MLPLYKRREMKHFGGSSETLPVNYRPISLTSVVGKLMEIIVCDKLMIFLEENIMIINTQQGFRNKSSCLTNLLDFYNDVFNIYDGTYKQ